MRCGSWTSDCSDAEKPVHKVCVDGFWMGKYVVTQGEWGKVMPDNPSKFKKGDIYPVEEVSWEHAMQFIRKLNKMNNGKYELRLPTDNAAGRQRISCTAPSDNFPRLLSGLLNSSCTEEAGQEPRGSSRSPQLFPVPGTSG
jgi:hypothetical protein